MLLGQTIRRVFAPVGIALSMTAAAASDARAHCDTMDGPVVTAARRALETGSPGYVLIWVRLQDEPEIRSAFQQALAVRKLGAQARQLADRYFFETVVRVHRQGEGEPYTGLKPAGTDQGAAIPAADRALSSGSIAELETLLVDGIRHELRERFRHALESKGFTPDDVAAGRAHVAAYVALMHFVESAHEVAAAAKHSPAHKTP